MTYKLIPTAVFMNGSRIDAIPSEPGKKITGMTWGTPEPMGFSWGKDLAAMPHLHVSKAARLLAKHRARDKRKRFTYRASACDKKRIRRLYRGWAKEIAPALPERAAVWRKRARNG